MTARDREKETRRGLQDGGDDMTLRSPRGGYSPSTATRRKLGPPTATTKFRPPTARRTLVDRSRLLHSPGDQWRRLILIHAPAGFGKTTLATQWCRTLEARGAVWTWLSVDPDDNNPVWFLAHLIEAIQKVKPALAIGLAEILEENGEEAERYVLTSLINQIHENGEHLAVVLDDWHAVTSPQTVSAVEYLLDYGCHHLTLIVTSRSRSGLPLGRMRMHDELIEISASELRFSVDETQKFLAAAGAAELSDRDAESLCSTTDGWVAALQLASLSLRDKGDAAELISHLSGHHRAIAGYLTENVLSNLDRRILDFMLAISITDRICGSLAGALSGIAHGQLLLEDLERKDLFLYALDEERRWFRFHHLFADFLRRRLERDYPGRTTELHRRAQAWFSENGMLREAVHHALAAGDENHAVSLVERFGTDIIEHSQMATLLGLVNKLPAGPVAASPRLQIDLAWAHVLLHHPIKPLGSVFDTFDAALANQPLSNDEREALSLEAALVKDIEAAFADRMPELGESAERCLEKAEKLRPFVVAAAANVATFRAFYRCDFTGARKWQDWVQPYFRQMTGPFSEVYGHCLAGMAAQEQLDINAAEWHFRTALRVALQGQGGATSHAARLAGAVLGDLLYEKGEIEEAEKLLDDSYKLGPEGGLVHFMLATYGTGARIKLLHNDVDAAQRCLDEGARIAQTLSLPRLAARIENEEVRARLHVGELPAPADGSANDSEIAVLTGELALDSALRKAIQVGSPEQRDAACRRAAALVRELEKAQRPRALLKAQLLHATCLQAVGQTAEADAVLAPAARQCTELGLVQLLRDDGPPS
ncbi:AAA family ATPase [Hoyosella sp. YIM 151337]|uniref:AAA family ATPase n=1 Tax=Hoyosella sp. YIM 151337 TaxID=2992742 RepID=UPI0022364FD6|nr:AAA family ATPase [Hoyosella sp. YIM 151337]MCW4353757.1 AAA family ATPase [Hoyosella sp. YIM 151337]